MSQGRFISSSRSGKRLTLNRVLRRTQKNDEIGLLTGQFSDHSLSLSLSLANALQKSTAGVALFDQRLRCIAINSSLVMMIGFPNSGWLGKSMNEILGEHATALYDAFLRVQDTQRPVRDVPVNIRSAKSAACKAG